MEETQTFAIAAYRDDAKTDLVEVLRIEDLGMMRSGHVEASGDETLIYLAKKLLEESGHEDVDSFFYTVERTR